MTRFTVLILTKLLFGIYLCIAENITSETNPEGTSELSKSPVTSSEPCLPGTYRNLTMLECAECPNGTVPNSNRNACDADPYPWIAVKRNVKIYFDTDKQLEIRTSSPQGINNDLRVWFYDKKNDRVGEFVIHFYDDSPVYYFTWCMKTTAKFPYEPPSTREKMWRINVTNLDSGIRILVHCNGVKVLEKLLSSCHIEMWNRDITYLKFPSDDDASDYYRFLRASEPKTTEPEESKSDEKIDDIPKDNNPCPDFAHHCASGDCWVREEIRYGVFANGSSYGITSCLCIIDGMGKDNDYLRRISYDSEDPSHYPMVRSIQCRGKGSNDMTQHKETKVTCGLYLENSGAWDNRHLTHWNTMKESGLHRVGNSHNCPDDKTWKIILIVFSSVAFVIILIVVICKLRQKGYCGGNTDSSTHQAIPSDEPPTLSNNDGTLEELELT